MSGINYNLRKIKAIALDVDGVLSPSTIPMNEDGVPLRMVNIKDGYALQLAVKRGLKIAIITGGTAKANEVRYNALGITDIFQGVAHKKPKLEEWMSENRLDPEEVVYVGDDIPDLPALRIVGLPCCPRDSASEVLQTADYISRFDGGYGCVRDILEQILKAQDAWITDDEHAFGW